jgi:predicted nucleic acid-binding protein
VDKSNYYTIKIDGVQYNRALYTNTDNKGLPTLAICSTNEIINNEDYTDLVIPAQVINDITLDIRDKDGLGVEATRNMIILIIIEELEDEHTDFEHSKRQLY